MNAIGPKPQSRANRTILTAICSMLLGLCAASCGQRGPLYLPGESPTTARVPDAATQQQATSSEEDDVGVNEADAKVKEDGEDDEETS